MQQHCDRSSYITAWTGWRRQTDSPVLGAVNISAVYPSLTATIAQSSWSLAQIACNAAPSQSVSQSASQPSSYQFEVNIHHLLLCLHGLQLKVNSFFPSALAWIAAGPHHSPVQTSLLCVSRIRVDLLSYQSKTTNKRNLDGRKKSGWVLTCSRALSDCLSVCLSVEWWAKCP